MLEKESSAQEVTREYLLAKYGGEVYSAVTDARWEEGTYEQNKERYWHIFTLILFSYLILKWVEKVF
jgi:hypothetical protein